MGTDKFFSDGGSSAVSVDMISAHLAPLLASKALISLSLPVKFCSKVPKIFCTKTAVKATISND